MALLTSSAQVLHVSTECPECKPAPLTPHYLTCFSEGVKWKGSGKQVCCEKLARLCQKHCVNLNSLYDFHFTFFVKKKYTCIHMFLFLFFVI